MPRQSERLARPLADVLRSDQESRPVATRAGGGPVNVAVLTQSGARGRVSLRHAYQSAPKNPAMSAANSSGASAAAKWPPRGMGVQRWMS
jgi:hypothetical protein